MRKLFVQCSIGTLILIGLAATAWPPIAWLYLLAVPVIGLGFFDMFQRRHTLMRNYPLLGRGRYFMEELRPKIYQYFVESDINGRPFNRVHRSVVYQRAKRDLDTNPFGTQLNVYEVGYEWLNHSISPLDHAEINRHPRVQIGNSSCKQTYSASLLNISAMSFGALSANAVLSLNGGAKLGNFAHNTGEGGVSSYHKDPGGDLIWQIGTGYFGCRTKDGSFNPEEFQKNAAHESVKMIEVKLSQGAKPGHGGILPAIKNSPEIAAIRGLEPHTTVISPPGHSAFRTPIEMMEFIQKLRELSGGKPIGFKLCVGRPPEFIAICKAMRETGITPDFVAVDGGEGGTGAAPVEFSNAVGMPLKEGLVLVHDSLVGFDLKKDVKIIAAGKVITGFDIVRSLALGADLCYCARGMMLALGCIQALECNSNTCPTGITTQNPQLTTGIVVEDKEVRIANYHHETVEAAAELIASAGLSRTSELRRWHISRRINNTDIRTYDQIYPYVEPGALVDERCPEYYRRFVGEASSATFRGVCELS